LPDFPSFVAEGEGQEALKRRNPAVLRTVSEVKAGSDRRVRLSGRITKKGQNGAVTFDDGTGKTEVFFDNLDVIDSIEKTYAEGEFVVLTGLVVPQDGGKFDISGEIIRKQGKSALPEDLIKRAQKEIRHG
jgi:hypothetical protein